MTQQQDLQSRLHIWVSGRVQGVGFRMYAYGSANRLNLVGWVRNRYNGDVEIVAEGPQDILLILLSEVRMGPPASVITDVKFIWEEPSGKFTRFDLLASL
jgi:acylphosphatase